MRRPPAPADQAGRHHRPRGPCATRMSVEGTAHRVSPSVPCESMGRLVNLGPHVINENGLLDPRAARFERNGHAHRYFREHEPNCGSFHWPRGDAHGAAQTDSSIRGCRRQRSSVADRFLASVGMTTEGSAARSGEYSTRPDPQGLGIGGWRNVSSTSMTRSALVAGFTNASLSTISSCQVVGRHRMTPSRASRCDHSL